MASIMHFFSELHILVFGVACLQLVVQQNWLGPALKNDDMQKVSNYFQVEGKKHVLKYLRRDGEVLFFHMYFHDSLYFAPDREVNDNVHVIISGGCPGHFHAATNFLDAITIYTKQHACFGGIGFPWCPNMFINFLF